MNNLSRFPVKPSWKQMSTCPDLKEYFSFTIFWLWKIWSKWSLFKGYLHCSRSSNNRRRCWLPQPGVPVVCSQISSQSIREDEHWRNHTPGPGNKIDHVSRFKMEIKATIHLHSGQMHYACTIPAKIDSTKSICLSRSYETLKYFQTLRRSVLNLPRIGTKDSVNYFIQMFCW